jgi:hypothetical protein
MGLRADLAEVDLRIEDRQHAPILGNAALTGAGPILQLLVLRRLLADGLQPQEILLEYWPAFLRGDGQYREELRWDWHRLRTSDDAVVRSYFTQPDVLLEHRNRMRRVPLFGYRKALLARWLPGWVPFADQTHAAWESIDAAGWLPGRAVSATHDFEKTRLAVASFYLPLFADFEVSAIADRALRESIDVCHQRGIRVTLLRLPEASWFAEMMSTRTWQLAEAHRIQLMQETGVIELDARAWIADSELPDGFHLSPQGAAEFSRRLMKHFHPTGR